jgi:hypothetical protein
VRRAGVVEVNQLIGVLRYELRARDEEHVVTVTARVDKRRASGATSI